MKIPGVSTSSPRFVDLLGDGHTELLLATERRRDPRLPLGHDRAARASRSHADVSPWWPAARPPPWPITSPCTAARSVSAVPAVGDLFRTATWRSSTPTSTARSTCGPPPVSALSTMSVNPAYSRDDPSDQDQYNRTKPGFASSPALGDLDGDGKLEIVAAAMDRHVYAWHADGSPVAGFPVLLVDPAKVSSVDPVSNKVTFTAGSGVQEGGELIATPTVADVNGDGRPEIVVGGQEQYVEPPNIGDGADVLGLLGAAGTPGNSSAVRDRARRHRCGLPQPVGQPRRRRLPARAGRRSSASWRRACCRPSATAWRCRRWSATSTRTTPGPRSWPPRRPGTLYVLDAHGASVYGATSTGDLPGGLGRRPGPPERRRASVPQRNSQDIVASLVGLSGPSLGELQGGGSKEIAANTAGLTRFIDLLAPDLQLPERRPALGVGRPDRRRAARLTAHRPRTSALFIAPAIADLDGSGHNQVIAGNGLYTLDAVDAQGAEPSGWPKLTGGWSIGTPGVGDWDGDGNARGGPATPRR